MLNESVLALSPEEHQLLKMGPKFIINDPGAASRRLDDELEHLRMKIENLYTRRWVRPDKDVIDGFLTQTRDLVLRCREAGKGTRKTKSSIRHARTATSLKKKLETTQVYLQKTDKSKVFHMADRAEYIRKAYEYMDKTQAYTHIAENPLADIVNRLNELLRSLLATQDIPNRLFNAWYITTAREDEVRLGHLYFLPKIHKPGTPLRPIVSGLHMPTLPIARYIDDLSRPLFNIMALKSHTVVDSGVELVKVLRKWTAEEGLLTPDCNFVTMDVTDLYTMIPQAPGVASLLKIIGKCGKTRLGELSKNAVRRLSLFIMGNSYFVFDGKYYHQKRGGAMGNPLTLTISNSYMFFWQKKFADTVTGQRHLMKRYIDDIIFTTGLSTIECEKLVEDLNTRDPNIQLSADIGKTVNFLDVQITNRRGKLETRVYHKPSHQPYFLPESSTHMDHVKRNLPFSALLRALRYSSTLDSYLQEKSEILVALMLNGYSFDSVERGFESALGKLGVTEAMSSFSYDRIRETALAYKGKKQVDRDRDRTFFVHFSFCEGMQRFPTGFHRLWNETFKEKGTALRYITPMVSSNNTGNLVRTLVRKKPPKALLSFPH